VDTDRLMRAASSAIETSTAFNGLRVVSVNTSHRGSSIELVNDAAAISVTADWLEGDLTVAIRPVGGALFAFEDLADAADAKGLSLARLPKGISTDSLARRLVQVLELLDLAVPGVLAGTDEAAHALRARSA
jgi:hypothetical protein